MTTAEQWRRAVAAGQQQPVAPRDAATVVLLRPTGGDGTAGPFQVCLLRRSPSMSLAPGSYVFPGGVVDPGDAAPATEGWYGPPPADWATRLDASPDRAAALVHAAARETFEEAGIVFASAPEAGVADTAGDPGWEQDRAAVAERRVALGAVLQRRGLVLRTDLMRPWARWVTPRVERRRYDARFFLALLPDGQQPRAASTESDALAWLTPEQALRGWRHGELPMLPPTVATLRELNSLNSLDAVLAAERDLSPFEPEVRQHAGTVTVIGPDGTEYPAPRI